MTSIADASLAAALSSRERLLLVALAVSGAALFLAFIGLISARARFRAHLKTREAELRRAFAEAYVGMKDSTIDARKVRDAERAIERILGELENFM